MFRLDSASGALTTLHDFQGPGEGTVPYGTVVQGSDGRLYGTTSAGGAGNSGTVYAIDTSGTFTTLHQFSVTDGTAPVGDLVLGNDGAFYGTTSNAGAAFKGTFFRITIAGTLTKLHDFDVDAPGIWGRSLVLAPDGDFYGLTGGSVIGVTPATFYRIDASGNFTLLLTGVHAGTMTVASDDRIYVAEGAVTRYDLQAHHALVWDPASFTATCCPEASLVESPAGGLYGWADLSTWMGPRPLLMRFDSLLTLPVVLHEFDPPPSPYRPLLARADGSVWGGFTALSPLPHGAIFKVDALGVDSLVHEFSGADGDTPTGALIEGPNGEAWGSTEGGGDNGAGNIFKIDSNGVFTPVVSFDTQTSFLPLVYAADGNFYGITSDGSFLPASSRVFRTDPLGLVTVHDFTPENRAPNGIFQASDGDFYGTLTNLSTQLDTIYRMDAAGTVTPLHDFTAGFGRSLMQATDGNFYGTYFGNFPNDLGNIFRMDSKQNVTVVHAFDTDPDGLASPTSGLLQASDGNLYGRTESSSLGSAFFRFLLAPAEPPSLASIDPPSGRAAGGARAVLHGAHFRTPAAVTFGVAAGAPTLVFDHSQLIVIAPALDAGALYDVTITDPDATTATLPAAWFADFLDVPSDHIFHDYVEKVFRNGITAGCGGGNYCPNAPVTRAQMAVFLLKAEHGSGYAPPACTGHFADVSCPDAFAVDWIEQLAAENITAGCGDGTNYCPNDAVSRQQMAVFLLKTEHGASYVPPPCAQLFADVACPSLFADWIERLAAENVTGGCGGGNYCPLNPSTRGQMATFLSKTFSLP